MSVCRQFIPFRINDEPVTSSTTHRVDKFVPEVCLQFPELWKRHVLFTGAGQRAPRSPPSTFVPRLIFGTYLPERRARHGVGVDRLGVAAVTLRPGGRGDG